MYEPRRNRAKWNLIKVLYIMSAEKRETIQILPNCKFWKRKAYNQQSIKRETEFIPC